MLILIAGEGSVDMLNREQGRQNRGEFWKGTRICPYENPKDSTECFHCFTVLKIISQLTWLLVCKAFMQIWKIFGQVILSFWLQYIDFQLSYILKF